METAIDLPLRIPAREGSLALAEMYADGNLPDNNNYVASIDFLNSSKSLSEGSRGEHSNSSSLESLNSLPGSLDNHMGSQTPDGSTSCSEDSFEMSSNCSTREAADMSPGQSPYKYREGTVDSFTSAGTDMSGMDNIESSVPPSSREGSSGREDSIRSFPSSHRTKAPPTTSVSMDSFMLKDRILSVRESIDKELNNLDTGLPKLDFDQLEKQLQTAAREREEHERKVLGEQVRRRLAMQTDIHAGPSPNINTKPGRSNLAHRLQTAMNLQVCYINEMSEMSSSDSSSSDSEEEFCVPKSRSVPNLRGLRKQASEDSEIQLLKDKVARNEKLTPWERQRLLRAETKAVLGRAKEAGQKQLELHRRTKSRASWIPRQSRQYLSKMNLEDIKEIHKTMEEAIAGKNVELVGFLMERDTLHMEHDSLLVDIDDFTEHESEAAALDFPRLMKIQQSSLSSITNDPLSPQSPGGISLPNFPGTSSQSVTSSTPTVAKQNQKSPSKMLSKFRLFRR